MLNPARSKYRCRAIFCVSDFFAFLRSFLLTDLHIGPDFASATAKTFPVRCGSSAGTGVKRLGRATGGTARPSP